MNIENYYTILNSLPEKVKLIAISKTKPIEDIMQLYTAGQRLFGENKALELKDKYEKLPKDIEWHFIGHLQTNKIKYIAPFISLIHSVDSFKLLKEINRFALKNNRIIPCLLQFHIASEDTKYGFDQEECESMFHDSSFYLLQNVEISGVMGMATFTDDTKKIRKEFHHLSYLFSYFKDKYFKSSESFNNISMGMTDDYEIAIEEGSSLIRIGSAIFGSRNYTI